MKRIALILIVLVLIGCWDSRYMREQNRYWEQRLEENKRTLDDAKKLEQELKDLGADLDRLENKLLKKKFHIQDV